MFITMKSQQKRSIFVYMKQKNSAANYSITLAFLLIVLSFVFGYRSYSQAEQRVVSDLNQALQKSVFQNKHLWLNTDTIQTYAKLQKVMEAPVIISSSNQSFTKALSIPQLREVSSLSIHILKKDESGSVFNEIPAGYLASDTLVWLTTTGASDLTLSFRGYAQCSPALLFALSDQSTAELLLLAAIIIGSISIFYFHRKSLVITNSNKKKVITFGNLSLLPDEACFYNEHREKLKLTPMQYALMEMFYQSSSHELSRSDICESLWPGKDNADETLYTLVRRLKPVIEDNSNLRIKTDRGRTYGLEIKT